MYSPTFEDPEFGVIGSVIGPVAVNSGTGISRLLSREGYLLTRLIVHIMELLAHVPGGPEHGNQEPCDESVQAGRPV